MFREQPVCAVGGEEARADEREQPVVVVEPDSERQGERHGEPESEPRGRGVFLGSAQDTCRADRGDRDDDCKLPQPAVE